MGKDKKVPVELNADELDSISAGARIKNATVAPKEETSVLFFDEADAIMGKRTAVKGAHSKYSK